VRVGAKFDQNAGTRAAAARIGRTYGRGKKRPSVRAVQSATTMPAIRASMIPMRNGGMSRIPGTERIAVHQGSVRRVCP